MHHNHIRRMDARPATLFVLQSPSNPAPIPLRQRLTQERHCREDELNRARRSAAGERGLGMHLYVAGESDVGRERQQNEDHMDLRQLDDGSWLMVVCDGMGGHEAGDVASEVATRSLVRSISDHAISEQPPRVLWDALHAANEAVIQEAVDRGIQGMGTTAVVGWVRDDLLWAAWVGDSRLYHFRRGSLELRTEDHTRVQKMVDMQILSQEEAKHHPEAHILTQALGQGGDNQSSLRPSVWSEPSQLEPGDALVLCSDGLFDLVEDEELYSLIGGLPYEEAVAHLIHVANDRGGHDNVTVIVASAGGPKLAAAPVKEIRKTIVEEAPRTVSSAGGSRPPRSTISMDNLFVPGPGAGRPTSVNRPGRVQPTSHVLDVETDRDNSSPTSPKKVTWLWVAFGVFGGLAVGALLTVAVVLALRFAPAKPIASEDAMGSVEAADVGMDASQNGVHVTAVAEVRDPDAFERLGDTSGASRVLAELGNLDLRVLSVERLQPARVRTVIAIDSTTHSTANWDRSFDLADRFADAMPDVGNHDVELVLCAEDISAHGVATTGSELKAMLRTLKEGAEPDERQENPVFAKALEELVLLAGRDTDADARQILLFMDASETLSSAEVIGATHLARGGHVSVFLVVFGLTSSDSSATVRLRRLARETSGEVMDAEAIDETTDAIGERARLTGQLVEVGLSVPATAISNGKLDHSPKLAFVSGTERAVMRTMYVEVPPAPEPVQAPTSEVSEEDAG